MILSHHHWCSKEPRSCQAPPAQIGARRKVLVSKTISSFPLFTSLSLQSANEVSVGAEKKKIERTFSTLQFFISFFQFWKNNYDGFLKTFPFFLNCFFVCFLIFTSSIPAELLQNDISNEMKVIHTPFAPHGILWKLRIFPAQTGLI